MNGNNAHRAPRVVALLGHVFMRNVCMLLFPMVLLLGRAELSFSSTIEYILQPSPGRNDGSDDGSISSGKDAFFYNCSGGWSGTLYLIEGYARSTCNECSAKAYIRFNIDNLPQQVDKAYLGVTHLPHTNYCYSMCNANFYLFPVLGSWNEVALPGAPPAEGAPVLGPINITFPNNFGQREYDITSLYNQWKNGTVENNGIAVYSTNAGCNNAAVRWMVYSSDETDASRRPYLRLLVNTTPETSSLQVNIEPSAVLALGAMWRLEGTQTWKNSGDVDTEVPLGANTVEFKPVSGWGSPVTTEVNIQPQVVNTLNARYRADTGLRFSGLNGQVEVGYKDEDGAYSLAKMDTVLYEGDYIRTGEDSTTIITDPNFPFVMPSETTVQVLSFADAMKRVVVKRGSIWMNIKNMIETDSMDIEMNQCVTTVKGTTVVCEKFSDTKSVVKVIEGTVAVTSSSPSMTKKVAAGKKVTAISDTGLGEVVDFDVTAEKKYWDQIRGTLAPSPSIYLLLQGDD